MTHWKRKLIFKEGFLNFTKESSEVVCDRIRPVDSQCPTMCSLPKIHKPNTPLGLILSMYGFAQQELAVGI